MEKNNLQIIKEAFYRLAKDPDITLEEVREVAKNGYIAAQDLNTDIKGLYSAIGRIFTI